MFLDYMLHELCKTMNTSIVGQPKKKYYHVVVKQLLLPISSVKKWMLPCSCQAISATIVALSSNECYHRSSVKHWMLPCSCQAMNVTKHIFDEQLILPHSPVKQWMLTWDGCGSGVKEI